LKNVKVINDGKLELVVHFYENIHTQGDFFILVLKRFYILENEHAKQSRTEMRISQLHERI
jgi:hypothetical protein